MRLSAILLCCSLAGVVLGAALIGVAAVGGAIIFDSLAVGVYALARETGAPAAPGVHEVSPLAAVLERARRAS